MATKLFTNDEGVATLQDSICEVFYHSIIMYTCKFCNTTHAYFNPDAYQISCFEDDIVNEQIDYSVWDPQETLRNPDVLTNINKDPTKPCPDCPIQQQLLARLRQ